MTDGMTRDDITRMAREAGMIGIDADGRVERFAHLVAAAEREACAKVCEETPKPWTGDDYEDGCLDCAEAIRARGEA